MVNKTLQRVGVSPGYLTRGIAGMLLVCARPSATALLHASITAAPSHHFYTPMSVPNISRLARLVRALFVAHLRRLKCIVSCPHCASVVDCERQRQRILTKANLLHTSNCKPHDLIGFDAIVSPERFKRNGRSVETI